MEAWTLAAIAVFALSAFVTWLSIAYSRRRNLIDHPGQRRSHSIPTPRGGGIGIVAGALLTLVVVFFWEQSGWERWIVLIAQGIAILLVALIGWIDDHRGLSACIRLITHCLAALVLVGWIPITSLVLNGLDHAWAIWCIVLPICIIAVAWSINLHNFMDGIDGLLATQALFVFVVLALLCAQAGRFVEAEKMGLFAAATLGFLPFNFPKARVFMGDVGSGVLGLLVILAVGWQMLAFPVAMASGLIACSAFIVDATATLLSRMLRGRRWYSAHREHLYQWLVRSGRTHVQVVAIYMTWNLFVVTPVLCWINRGPTGFAASWFVASGGVALIFVYLLAVLVWIAGKRYCLKTAKFSPGDMGAQ